VRYGLALIIVLTLPPALPFGVFIHPFVRFCRALGSAWTYGLVGGLIALAMVGLAIEFGTNLPLLASGLLCLAAARWLRLRLHRHMGPSVLTLSVVLALWLLLLFLIVRLEEGELRERFGPAYEEVVDVHHASAEDPPEARAPELAPLVELPQQVPASSRRCCCGDIPIQPGTPSLQAISAAAMIVHASGL
jgi:hypothetical protein